MIYGPGCIDQWQHELQRAPKSGLITQLEMMAMVYRFDRQYMLNVAKEAQRDGRRANLLKRIEAFRTDPRKSTEQWTKRRAAAKKAARRRKKAR